MTGVGQQRVGFDARALYWAVQDEREGKGWSWRDLEVGVGVRSGTTRRLRRALPGVDHDAEHILRLATWVSRSVESFAGRSGTVIDVPPQQIHLDGPAFLAQLERQRSAGDLSWRQAAAELHVGVRSLERLAAGGRLRLHLLLQASRWTERSIAELVTASRLEGLTLVSSLSGD